MRLPHWLRHHWTAWKPHDQTGRHGQVFAFGPSVVDERVCERCGRRQRRYP